MNFQTQKNGKRVYNRTPRADVIDIFDNMVLTKIGKEVEELRRIEDLKYWKSITLSGGYREGGRSRKSLPIREQYIRVMLWRHLKNQIKGEANESDVLASIQWVNNNA